MLLKPGSQTHISQGGQSRGKLAGNIMHVSFPDIFTEK
jgi:hypothetical protein